MVRPSLFSRFCSVLLAVHLPLMLGACGSSSTTTPTTPTPVTATETFSGTFNQLGSAVHPFHVSVTGTVTIGLTAVEPLATMGLGVAIASWDSTSATCSSSATAKNDDARAGATALTGTAVLGNYCVRVYDSGNIPVDGSVTYTVQVVHP